MNVCPRLPILRLPYLVSLERIDLREILKRRRNNVEAGLAIGGIKMESLKRVYIPFDRLDESELGEIRELVDQLVDSNLEPKRWKVEI